MSELYPGDDLPNFNPTDTDLIREAEAFLISQPLVERADTISMQALTGEVLDGQNQDAGIQYEKALYGYLQAREIVSDPRSLLELNLKIEAVCNELATCETRPANLDFESLMELAEDCHEKSIEAAYTLAGFGEHEPQARIFSESAVTFAIGANFSGVEAEEAIAPLSADLTNAKIDIDLAMKAISGHDDLDPALVERVGEISTIIDEAIDGKDTREGLKIVSSDILLDLVS
jgi:hypothetical protein